MRLLIIVISLACGFITNTFCNENVSPELENVVLEKMEDFGTEFFEPLPKTEIVKNQVGTSRTANSQSNDPLYNVSALARSGALKSFDVYLGELSYDVTDGYDWNNPDNRMAPPNQISRSLPGYVITSSRLAEIRSHMMYWYFDQDMNGGRGDYQFDIHASMTQLHKNLNFQLPFMGFRLKYT